MSNAIAMAPVGTIKLWLRREAKRESSLNTPTLFCTEAAPLALQPYSELAGSRIAKLPLMRPPLKAPVRSAAAGITGTEAAAIIAVAITAGYEVVVVSALSTPLVVVVGPRAVNTVASAIVG